MKSLHKGTFRLGCALIGFFLSCLVSFAAPANDKFSDALLLPGVIGFSPTITLAGATPDPFETGTTPSVWYRFNAPFTGAGIIWVNGQLPSRIDIYEQTASSLVLLTQNFTTYQATMNVQAGSIYYISVRTTSTASLTMNYRFPTLGLSEPLAATLVKAPGNTSCEATNAEPGGQFQSIKVWGGHTNFPASIIATGTSFPLAFTWTNSIAGGARVWIEATTAEGQIRQSDTNFLSFRSSNDAFADAIELDPVAGEFLLQTSGATRETGEPGTGSSIWYRLTPNFTGKAQFDIGISDSTAYRLYRGSTLSTLAIQLLPPIANTTSREASVEAGVTYYIAVAQTTVVRQFRYAVTTMQFSSPTSGATVSTPGIINLALENLPNDVVSVDYYGHTNKIATVTDAPFSYDWNTPLTGNLRLTAIAQNAAGDKYYASIRIVRAIPSNDNSANALILPPGLTSLDFHSSTLFATRGADEPTSAETWWKWTPDRSGFATINISETTPTIRILPEFTPPDHRAPRHSERDRGPAIFDRVFR